MIKEQNMLDVFVLVEGYCHLFVERLDLVDKEKLVVVFFVFLHLFMYGGSKMLLLWRI